MSESAGCVCTPIDLGPGAAISPHLDDSISGVRYLDPENTTGALQISIIPYLCHFRSVSACHTDNNPGSIVTLESSAQEE